MSDLHVKTPLGEGVFMLASIATGAKKTIRYLVWVPTNEPAVALYGEKYHLIRMDKTRALFAFTEDELGLTIKND